MRTPTKIDKTQKSKRFIITSLLLSIKCLYKGLQTLFLFFDRNETLISQKGQMILEDKEDRKKVFNAIRNGETSVITKQGKIYLH